MNQDLLARTSEWRRRVVDGATVLIAEESQEVAGFGPANLHEVRYRMEATSADARGR